MTPNEPPGCMSFKIFTFCALIGMVIMACQKPDSSVERARKANIGTGEIQIAAVGSWSQDTDEAKAWNGIEMAAEEINGTDALRGRKLVVVKKDDKGTLDGALLAAGEISSNPDLVAVIGHSYSYTTVPSARLYKTAGILHISPIAKSHELMEQDNMLLINLQVGLEQAARSLARIAGDKGLRKIALIYVNDEYGTGIATEFEKFATERDVKIIDSTPYWLGDSDKFKIITAKWKTYDFDALFFGGHHDDFYAFVRAARQAGINKPILTDATPNVNTIEALGSQMNGVVFTSYLDILGLEKGIQTSRDFIRNYTARYGIPPDRYSANSYEAVQLLVAGIRASGSTIPAKVAEQIRTMKGWHGVSGRYDFNRDGSVTGKPVLLMEYNNGRLSKAAGSN